MTDNKIKEENIYNFCSKITNEKYKDQTIKNTADSVMKLGMEVGKKQALEKLEKERIELQIQELIKYINTTNCLQIYKDGLNNLIDINKIQEENVKNLKNDLKELDEQYTLCIKELDEFDKKCTKITLDKNNRITKIRNRCLFRKKQYYFCYYMVFITNFLQFLCFVDFSQLLTFEIMERRMYFIYNIFSYFIYLDYSLFPLFLLYLTFMLLYMYQYFNHKNKVKFT